MHDEELVRAAQNRDQAAFEKIVEQNLDAVHFYIGRRCSRWNMVEDITHETFARAWESITQFQQNSSLKTWLIGIARNVHLEQLRTQDKRLQSLDAMLTCGAPDDDENSTSLDNYSHELVALNQCIQKVNERGRKLLQARYRDERSLKELASAYGKKAETLGREIRRLASKLRLCVEKHST